MDDLKVPKGYPNPLETVELLAAKEIEKDSLVAKLPVVALPFRFHKKKGDPIVNKNKKTRDIAFLFKNILGFSDFVTTSYKNKYNPDDTLYKVLENYQRLSNHNSRVRELFSPDQNPHLASFSFGSYKIEKGNNLEPYQGEIYVYPDIFKKKANTNLATMLVAQSSDPEKTNLRGVLKLGTMGDSYLSFFATKNISKNDPLVAPYTMQSEYSYSEIAESAKQLLKNRKDMGIDEKSPFALKKRKLQGDYVLWDFEKLVEDWAFNDKTLFLRKGESFWLVSRLGYMFI